MKAEVMPPKITASLPAPHERILAITLEFWQSRALAVAAELELAEALAEGPLHVDVLANRTRPILRRYFVCFAHLKPSGVLSQASPFVITNTPASECLRKDVPDTQWAWVRAQLSVGGGVYEGWSGFGDSIHTGETAFDQVFGCNF
jgi:hypothetical protein